MSKTTPDTSVGRRTKVRRSRVAGAVLAAAALTAGGLAAGASTVSAAPAAGGVQPRIVGGDPATVAFAVSLQTPDENGVLQHHCGGSLIASRWVLTASHCTEIVTPQAGGQVRVGSVHRDSGGTLVPVRAAFKNPQNTFGDYSNDIGLLQLDRPVPAARLLPLAAPVRVGSTSLVQGWGVTCDTDVTDPACRHSIPSALQQLPIRRLPGAACDVADPTTGEGLFNDRTMLCMTSADSQPRMACFGDSGSPILRQLPSGRPAVTGVVVGDGDSADLHPHVCTTTPDGTPGTMIDTNASAFLGFILHTILRHDRPAAQAIQNTTVTTS